MKKFIFALALLSLSAQAAQVVDKDLVSSGNWKSALISQHNLWKKNACLAYTKATDGAVGLEVYAEQLNDNKDAYTEPTVQVVLGPKDTGFLRGVITSDTGTALHLTLASTTDTPPALGLLARIDDRKKIIDLLRRASTVKVQLVNAKGKATKTYTFSLKGSTKVIDGAIAACKLAI